MTGSSSSVAALRGASGWLAAIAESTSAGFFLGREQLLYANPTLARMLGTTVDELLARDPLWLLPGESALPASTPAGAPAGTDGGSVEIGGLRVPAAYRIELPSGEHATVLLATAELADGPAVSGVVVELGEGSTAEESQLSSDAWFRTLAETTSTAIFAYRDAFLYVNRAAAELTGYPAEELIGVEPLEIIHPDFRALASEIRSARLRGDPVPEHYELILLTKSGEERWVDFTAGLIQYEGSQSALGTAFDITDRKRAELALRTSEERLAMAQHAAGVVTWDWNLLTDELVLSSSAAEFLGQEPGKTPSTSRQFFDQVVHPQDSERVLEATRQAIRSGDGYMVEHRFVGGDGAARWLVQRGQVIRDESGWAVRVVGVAIEITERKEAELALGESEERLRLIVQQLPALLWTTDHEAVVTSSLGAGLAKLELDPDELVGRPIAQALATDEPDPETVHAHRRALEGESVSYELVWSESTYQAHVEPLRNREGEIVGTIGVALDVTERQQAEEALFREQKRAHATLASIGDGVIRTDAEQRIDDLNPQAEELLGFTVAEARQRPLAEIYQVIDEVSREPVATPVERCLSENRPVVLPGRRLLVARDGREVVIRDSAAPIRDRKGEARGAVLAFKDVTAVRAMEQQMSYLVTHDRLTGLLNRAEFERHLGRALETAADKPCAVLMLDVAQLTVVNDTCGHLAGDQLLQRVAETLAARARDDVLARVGADEFALLLAGRTAQEARRKAEQVLAAFHGFRFAWQDRGFEIGVAIGLVPVTPGDNVASVMIAADTACTLAKESGRNRIHEYQGDDETLASRYGEMHWVHRIYRALDEEKLRLYCQPIQPLQEPDHPDRLICEVLLRMEGEDGELISPRDFVPIAERYRLISHIDRWVVRKSFEALTGWASLGGRRVTHLAINLSGESLSDEAFHDYVREQLDETGVDPDRASFEITETATIANLGGALSFINDMRELGCRFILDDFGSGLSSFAYLKNLPVDTLKIAREFVSGVAEPGIQSTLVRSFNQIGHDLGLRTIAEGVEDEKTLQAIRDLKLDYAQGYWIAPPQALEYW